MTSEERLRIAEEIGREFNGALLHDMQVLVGRCSNGKWFSAWNGDAKLAECDNAIDCIHLARQKLAAEREAAMTPNERKYKAALELIVSRCGHQNDSKPCVVASDIAKEALKD